MIPQKALNVQISQKIEELTQKLAIAEQRAELAEQQRDSCQAFILDLKAERDQLAAENIEQRETIADLEQRNDDQADEISRYVTKISEHDQEWNRLYRLLSNPQLSLTLKLFLWMYRREILSLHTDISEPTRICLESVAGKLGLKRDTARRANEKLTSACNAITIQHEKTELDNGDIRTLVHVAIKPDLDKSWEFLKQEGGNKHGGARVYTCGRGHANIDRFAAQYCRECDSTAFYGLPGLRADADVSAMINSIVKEHGGENAQKQVAFTPPTVNEDCHPHQSNEQTAVAVAEPIIIPQKQDAFGTPAQKQPILRCNCGALQWEWNNLRQRWLCGWCNSVYNRLI